MNEPLVGLLETVWASIVDVCEGITEDQWALPTECPGWTVQDQVAHMIGTERMLLGDAAPEVATDVKALAHVKNDIGAFNEVWVEHYRSLSPADVVAEFRSATARRLDQLRAMTAEDWDREGFTPEGPGPYRKFMAIRVFDCWMHEQDIRDAVHRRGDIEGTVADLALAKLRDGMPYVVGKKAGASQGSTVVFDVAGPAGFELSIGVEGRAAILDESPTDPTARLRMDDQTFVGLAAGRLSGEQVLAEGRVLFDGDELLGRAVVANMGFTI